MHIQQSLLVRSGLFGKALKDQMKEQVTKKITTHQKFTPASSAYDLDLLNIYQTNLTNFMNLVAECKEADLDKCILNSPAINWITYSL